MKPHGMVGSGFAAVQVMLLLLIVVMASVSSELEDDCDHDTLGSDR